MQRLGRGGEVVLVDVNQSLGHTPSISGVLRYGYMSADSTAGGGVRMPILCGRRTRLISLRKVTDMGSTWDTSWAGVLQLPSGRLVRGRGLRRPLRDGAVPE